MALDMVRPDAPAVLPPTCRRCSALRLAPGAVSTPRTCNGAEAPNNKWGWNYARCAYRYGMVAYFPACFVLGWGAEFWDVSEVS